MIRITNLTHSHRQGDAVFSGASIDIPSDRRVAILGGPESGKTTLLHLLSGLVSPGQGRIARDARLSFPAGYQRGFRIANSSRQNVMFAARIYDADPEEVFAFVRAVTGFGDLLDEPMRDMPVAARLAVSYAMTYAIPFDTYLFDNAIGTGQPEFRRRCRAMFDARSEEAGAILATRQPRLAEELCECAVLIREGGLVWFEDVREATAAYAEQNAAPAATADAAMEDAA